VVKSLPLIGAGPVGLLHTQKVRNEYKKPTSPRMAEEKGFPVSTKWCDHILATFRRKNDVCGIEVNGLPQNKTRRGERRA
jgi:hypothetical protein